MGWVFEVWTQFVGWALNVEPSPSLAQPIGGLGRRLHEAYLGPHWAQLKPSYVIILRLRVI
jgi:hypothetical protein